MSSARSSFVACLDEAVARRVVAALDPEVHGGGSARSDMLQPSQYLDGQLGSTARLLPGS